MKHTPPLPKRGLAESWTAERLSRLDRKELLQLRGNAARLAEPELAARCDDILKDLPSRGPRSSGAAARRKDVQALIPRSRAFQAQGVWLRDARTSWSGVRKEDGAIVFGLWAGAVDSGDGGCACLLWKPNDDGERPWSDSAAGRERLEHCVAALRRGGGEGLLVHGEAAPGLLPEDRARSITGIAPDKVVKFRVEKRGEEYWAVWGKR
jgi:hypothetical protein